MKDFLTLFATCISAVAALISIIVTSMNAKKAIDASKEQTDEIKKENLRQEERYQKDKIILEEYNRIREQPYFTFIKAERSKLSDNLFIDLTFKNEGRGKSYKTYPKVECKTQLLDDDIKFRRIEPNRTPVIKVDDEFTTTWYLTNETGAENFIVIIPIGFCDASGRKYNQIFEITISSVNGNIHADATDYSEPLPEIENIKN